MGATVLDPSGGAAQTAFRAANATTSIVPRGSGFVHADFAEARLTLEYLHEFLGPGLGLAPYAGAAARKGQVDMFGAFDFNPGFEAGVLAFLSLGRGARSLSVVSVAVTVQSTERKLIQYSADSLTVTFVERTQRDAILSAGVNLALGGGAVLGVGGSARREWSSPGVTRAVEVCVRSRVTGGLAIPLCENRYATVLRDYWAGQLRTDVLWNVLPLGRAVSGPHLAMMGSTSLDVGLEGDPRWNVGAGVGVAPLRYPGHVIVALLVELYDVTDANGQAPTFADRFVTRLVLGVPFDMLVN